MYSDLFEVRVARVRHRFAATLANKIETAMVSADRIARDDGSVVKHVSESYRHLHSIYGVGATVGFAGTGEAAHAAEAALIQAYRERRPHSGRAPASEEGARAAAGRGRVGAAIDVSARGIVPLPLG